MRILRIRPGFQADHSSSSYLFYAVDGEVSEEGQELAETFSSSAEVDEQYARYHKYGESELTQRAYPALLGQHYDVMAGESYDDYYLWIAVPKTPPMEVLLGPFSDIDDGCYHRMSVHDYGKRLAIEMFCTFEDGVDLPSLNTLVKRLARIREEILQGDVSFLQAVAAFYLANADEDEDEKDEEDSASEDSGEAIPAHWTKAELQQECNRRGITYGKSWTKEQLRQALTSAASRTAIVKPAKLSSAARRIVALLDYRG
jgi:hypothetical protein